MDYLEYAKQIERNGIEYYEKLKNESDTAEVKSIFSFMERQEQRHLEIFEAWQKEMEPTPIEAENVVGTAREEFKKMVDHFHELGVPAIDRSDAYEEAIGFEEKSISLYTEALEKTDNPTQQEQLKRIIEQEKAHAAMLRSMIAFQKHPGGDLTNAELYRFFDEES